MTIPELLDPFEDDRAETLAASLNFTISGIGETDFVTRFFVDILV